MNNQKREKIIEAGKFISKEVFNQQVDAYNTKFPSVITSFKIKKSLILKVLQSSSEVIGIRFMFGLTDELNPNSVRIILTPCTNKGDYGVPKPLIFKDGYTAHTGEKYLIQEVTQMIANFVLAKKRHNNELKYREITRGSFFGLNSLSELVDDDRCEYVLFNFGLKGNVISPILEPLDYLQQTYKDVFMNFPMPCPSTCDDYDPDNPGSCELKLAVKLFSDNQELDIYRDFRDNHLLDLIGGPQHFETYYFISPLIVMKTQESENKEELLRSFYFDMAIPLKELLVKKKYQKAVDFLSESLDNLINLYSVDYIYSNL